MTMNLAHPALTTTGHRRGPKKWASAQQKQQHQELESQWQSKMKELAKLSPMAGQSIKKMSTTLNVNPRIPPGRKSTRHIPSLNSTHIGAVSSPARPIYTGDKIIGVTIVHKSCLQPVFNKQQAEDAAKMRR